MAKNAKKTASNQRRSRRSAARWSRSKSSQPAAKPSRPAADRRNHTSGRRWSHQVKTESTFPPAGLYKQDAQTIARVMATRKVSPKGLGSAIRMVQFYINRAGKNLSKSRRRDLEKAKAILQEKNHRQKQRAGKTKTRAKKK